MYLSKLSLDPRSRQVVAELNNRYELHRTLMAAFPPDSPGRVLYRLEQRREHPPDVLVQSSAPPDWSHLERNGYLRRPPRHKEFSPEFRAGQCLAFRLRANPTVTRDGSRLGLLDESEQRDWLARKADRSGFSLRGFRNTPEGFLRMRKADRTLTFYSVLYEGALAVTDPASFVEALCEGIGPAKAFGFGLLSTAPATAGRQP